MIDNVKGGDSGLENHAFLNETEKDELRKYYADKLDIELELLDSQCFYQALLKKLPHNSEIIDDSDLVLILEEAKIGSHNGEEFIYVIENFPDKILKLSKKILIDTWEDLWCSPEDDGVVLFIPRVGFTILVTHWGKIYYG
ncbi:hypothetical protein [Parapedobacter koreensis]|uniref:Uncharacterized protein n=1 Tax=Parapedobacter koreensis TaxID=332977 RepID=A0A1H7UEU0_9SPHI|nr:hypothetical protein [Parapedobacter koreensis]SEL95481.1 hypothetical protein SAMN05421740_11528 [Parapedobacter koreensis]